VRAFTVLFALELALKLAAWGASQYFIDAWNQVEIMMRGHFCPLRMCFFLLPLSH